MTKETIAYVIDKIGGYSLNQVFEFSEVQAVILKSDHCVYPGKTTFVKFSTSEGGISCGLMMLYEAKYNNKTKEFEPKSTPVSIIPFEEIEGFTLVTPERMPQPYRIGRSI